MSEPTQHTNSSPGPTWGHVLSEKSAELHRDTFVFAPSGYHPTKLLFGLNQKLTPISCSKLHRWVNAMSGRTQEFFLCPVAVKTYGILSYSVTPNGPIIEADSDELLPPGDYGWYRDRNFEIQGFHDLYGVILAFSFTSFEYLVKDLEEADEAEEGVEEQRRLYTISSDLEELVHARDSRRCRVTGSTEDTILVWIVPPPWAWAVAKCPIPMNFDTSHFIVAANILTLRKDLRVHFYNHNWSIDVDDDYRIVVFRDMGGEQALLPTHLPRGPNDDPAADEFFRLHFRATLNFMLLHGDISETYPPGVILGMMDQLGVGDDNTEEDMVPLSDERWHTELGKAILANDIQTRVLLADDSDDSYSEGSGSDGVKEPVEFWEGGKILMMTPTRMDWHLYALA